MDEHEMERLLSLAYDMIGGKGLSWYERVLVKQADRIQLATLAVVIAIYRKLDA